MDETWTRVRAREQLPVPTESEEQQALMQWAARRAGKHPELALLFHIPNGGSRGRAEAGRFKAEGVKSGVPDLFLPAARGPWHGLFIELKRRRSGRISVAQKIWLQELKKQGYAVAVCRGWEEAANVLARYMEGSEWSM